jgi:lipoprotein NlpI
MWNSGNHSGEVQVGHSLSRERREFIAQDEMRSAAVGGEAARVAKHSCEVAFYLGEYALIRRRQDEAMKLFQQATETCPSEIIERNAAMAELNRLHR